MLRSKTHEYIEHKYPKNHWAINPTEEGTCIAFIQFRSNYHYVIKLNPTDRRGYRLLITYIGNGQSDIQSTFNRSYTLVEQKGLLDVTALVIETYKNIGLPIVQTAQAGNNAHSLNETSGITQIGNIKEPSMLHAHVWGRGNPQYEYITGIPLDGPKPGEIFDMTAKTHHIPGNQKKVPWTPNQLSIALQIIKKALQDYMTSIEFQVEFSTSLQVNIFEPKKIVEELSTTSFYMNNKVIDLTFDQNREKNQELTLFSENQLISNRTKFLKK
jgi:hypothetical protein